MTVQRAHALWSGWSGTVLFVFFWLMISRISILSFPLWVGLMLLTAVMCFYAGARRTCWFLLPGFAALIVTGGVVYAASLGQ